jgi:hypothetical protein
MIWGKRSFQWADYAPYQDRLGDLLMKNPTRYREFMMFSVEQKAGLADIYVGVPAEEFMLLFDGFEHVGEDALPKVVDSLLVADANAFAERFEFRHNLRRS